MKRIIKDAEAYDLTTNILESMQDMVRVIDQEGNVIFMNKTMREKFGDLIGKKCYEAIDRTERCVDCISERSLRIFEPHEKEERLGDRIYSVISSPILSQSTQKVFSVEVFRDITDQKLLEKSIFDQYSKMKVDLNLAKQLQRKIIHEDAIYGDAIRVISKYEPSEALGGDIFDIIEIDEDNIGIYIADVSGHGVSASMFTLFLRQIMRNKKNKSKNIEETIDDLIYNFKELNVDPETYFTVLYGIYNKPTQEITFVNAGHNCYPIIITGNNELKEIDINGFPICSLIDRSMHNSIKIKLNKGDRVLFYTDGLVESYDAKSNTFFGYEGLFKALEKNIKEKSEVLISNIYDEAIRYSSEFIKDDIAVVLFEII